MFPYPQTQHLHYSRIHIKRAGALIIQDIRDGNSKVIGKEIGKDDSLGPVSILSGSQNMPTDLFIIGIY